MAARELDGPVGDVLLRVGDDDRRARGATGAVDARSLVGHGLQAQRVGVAQIVLSRRTEASPKSSAVSTSVKSMPSNLAASNAEALLRRGELLLIEGELVVGKLMIPLRDDGLRIAGMLQARGRSLD